MANICATLMYCLKGMWFAFHFHYLFLLLFFSLTIKLHFYPHLCSCAVYNEKKNV